MAKALQKFTKSLSNTKTRTVVLFFGVVFVVAIAITISQMNSSTDPLSGRKSTTSAIPENIKAVPGNKTPEKYLELQLVDNERRAEQAKESDQSAIPTIVHTDILKGTQGGFGLDGNESIHGRSSYGPYGMEPDGEIFGVGPDGKPYDTEGWEIHGFGPHGPYGIGPDGKPYGIAPDGKPYGMGPNGKMMVYKDGKWYQVGDDGELSEYDYPYGPGGSEFAKHFANAEGYEVHGYGPYGPYGVGPDGEPFGIGPDGKPYDSRGPFAPDWYEPPELTASDILAQQVKADRERAEQIRREREERARRREQQQQTNKNKKQNDQEVAQKFQAMDAQAKALMEAWSTYPSSIFVMGNNEPSGPPPGIGGGVGTSGSAGGTGGGGGLGSSGPPEVIKAGTILFATVDTSVNSDVAGPILATVVHGPYKGARIIGSFTPPVIGSESLNITFNVMSLPDMDASMSMTAVAIDPDTARTAIASDVDHHYLLRYGTLFASSFMAGYSEAITEAGATTTTQSDGSTTTSTADLSGTEQIMAALGQVGTSWSESASSVFDTLPTITINQGTGIGILMMDDLDVGQARNGGGGIGALGAGGGTGQGDNNQNNAQAGGESPIQAVANGAPAPPETAAAIATALTGG